MQAHCQEAGPTSLMTDLVLQNNSISGQLAPEWGSMPKMYILNLSLNHVSSWPYSQHTHTWARHVSLRDLQHSCLHVVDMVRGSTAERVMCMLRSWSLRYHLGAQMADWQICKFGLNLGLLDLSSNLLSGSVPSSMNRNALLMSIAQPHGASALQAES